MRVRFAGQQTVWSHAILQRVLAGSGKALQPAWQIVQAMPPRLLAAMPGFSIAAVLTCRITGGD